MPFALGITQHKNSTNTQEIMMNKMATSLNTYKTIVSTCKFVGKPKEQNTIMHL